MFRAIVAVAAAVLAVAANAAEPAWRAAETKHFVIYSKSDNKRIEALATDLESYDKLIRMATGINDDAPPVKVRIYEVDGLGEIQEALGLDSYSGVAGFYDSNSLGPFLVTPRSTGHVDKYFTPELVIHHEYAHHLMLQYFPASYPGWYTEGFAELIGSSKVLDDGRIGYGMPAEQRGHQIAAHWVPLQELLTNEKVWNLDTYGEGWAVTHFFTFDSHRAAEFRRYLEAINHGKSFEEAAKVFGDLSDLNREARRYVTSGSFAYRPVKVEIAKPVIQRFRAVSPGEAALIPEVIAFRDDDLQSIKKEGRRERERKLREESLDVTREVARRYANDPFALRFLAEAEFSAGNYARSEAAADRLLRFRPNDVHALARKAIAMSVQAKALPAAQREARAEEARALAVKANHLNKNDPLPLLAYYESYHAAGEPAPKVAVTGLMQVVSMRPRETLPRELLVDDLASRRRWREAIGWLGPLANSPHDSPLRDSAREKMEWLKAMLARANGTATATK